MQMTRNLLPLGVLGLMFAGQVFAADVPFGGEYQGTGRQCFGKLSIQDKTIEWRTPFAACKKTPYRVLKQESGAFGQEAVFLLQGKSCGFGVIVLGLDPKQPDYWNATGYRSMADYEKGSDDKLLCSVERLPERPRR
ncbi:hypothetical protein SAMN05518845_12085 [Variovorax sp. YR750]|uniref:hypothetical protein n=1 Tax=Variovorax sp. YR750 TaxID=1884384 RepID=UPI0008D0E64A|nr:hypothetical protein [Variovorax sp. YR750]SEM31708.1 hypothetical protein SAMN05518845_12085 [Variovorax sp. YR750]